MSLLRELDFSGGNFSQWYGTEYAGAPSNLASVVSSPTVHGEPYSGQFYTGDRNGGGERNRCQETLDQFTSSGNEGAEEWYSFSFRIDTGSYLDPNNGWNNLTSFHQSVNNTLIAPVHYAFSTNNSSVPSLYITSYGGNWAAQDLGDPANYIQYYGSGHEWTYGVLTLGQWYDVVHHTYWHHDNTLGWFENWINGVRWMPLTYSSNMYTTTRTGSVGSRNYLKCGYDTGGFHGGPATIRHACHRISTDSATAWAAFNNTAPPATPTINSFVPGSGPVGTIVTVTGTNFSSVTSVQVGGVTASYTVDSSTQITLTVPAGTSGGAISVTTSAGSTSYGNFVLTTGSVYALGHQGPPSGTTLTLGGYSNDYKRVNIYTPLTDGTISESYLYVGGNAGGSAPTRMLVYAVSSGQPTSLLGESAQVTIAQSQTPGWVKYTFSSPVAVSASVPIALGYHYGSAGIVAYYDTSTGADIQRIDTYAGGASNPWTASEGGGFTGTYDYAFLMYVLVAAAADTTAPNILAGSRVVTGRTVTLQADETLDPASLPGASSFVVRRNSAVQVISGVLINGTTITVTLADSFFPGDTGTISYTAPASNPIQDLAGNDLASFSNYALANQTGQVPRRRIEGGRVRIGGGRTRIGGARTVLGGGGI